MRVLAVTVMVQLVVAVAAAQPPPRLTILVESHAGSRPAPAEEYVAAVAEGLGSPRPLAGAELEEATAARVSRYAGTADYPLLNEVRSTVIDAQEDLARARFTQAVARMDRLRSLVVQQAAAVGADPRVRKALFLGTLALLKSLARLQRQGEAESLAVEIARSFPDFVVTEREHGTEVFEFISRVRRQNWPRAVFPITIETSPPGAAVFLNERFVGTSPVKVPDALPGRYRVMARAGAHQSRIHLADVVEAAVEVRIDLPFDHALGHHGFVFADEAERTRHGASYALRLARALGAAEVITVGMSGAPERPLWTGTVYNVDTGGVLRSASVSLAPLAPPRTLLVSLGRFLRAGQPITEGIIVQQARPIVGPAGPVDRPAGSVALKVLGYLALAGGAALAGYGSYLLYLNGRGTCTLQPGQLRCPETHRTLASGASVLAVGGALIATGITLLVLDAKRSRLQVGMAPPLGRGPALVWLQGGF